MLLKLNTRVTMGAREDSETEASIMRVFLLCAVLFAIQTCAPGSVALAEEGNAVLDFTLDSIDGKPYALSQHKGEVLLLVNVASR
jgi:hypothetical protein